MKINIVERKINLNDSTKEKLYSKLNKFEKCKITEISDYDLVAEFK